MRIVGAGKTFRERLHDEPTHAVAFATHRQKEAAMLPEQIVVMERGGIRQAGTPREIYRDPRGRFVSRSIGHLDLLLARLVAACADSLRIEVGWQVMTLPPTVGRGPQTTTAAPYRLGFQSKDARIAGGAGLPPERLMLFPEE